jgi:hypothetical protein
MNNLLLWRCIRLWRSAPFTGFSVKIEIIILNSPFSIPMPKPTTHQALLRLIEQAADEGWEELDLSGMGLEELPQSIGLFPGILLRNPELSIGQKSMNFG